MRSKICGKSINSWVIFIGFLYLLQGIISSTIFAINLVKYQENKSKITSQGMSYDEDKEIVSELSVSLSLSLTFVLTTPPLIWGALKDKHLYLLPWLYNTFICVFVNCIYFVVMVLKNIFKLWEPTEKMENFKFMALSMALGLTLQFIFYKIVYKLYKELLRERELESPENSNRFLLVYNEETL